MTTIEIIKGLAVAIYIIGGVVLIDKILPNP